MRLKGYTITRFPNGKFGPDIQAESSVERFFLSVERCQERRWSRGEFAFSEVNVLERRGVFNNTLYITVRSDLKRGLIVFSCDIAVAELVESSNRYMPEKEFVRKIPVYRCLPVDLEVIDKKPICVMNAERVRQICSANSGLSRDYKNKVLSPICPYGLANDEWIELLAMYGPRPIQKQEIIIQPMLF